LPVVVQEQLAYGTGGPPNAKLLYTLEDLREDFSDLEIDPSYLRTT
jgi:hypothetical protein